MQIFFRLTMVVGAALPTILSAPATMAQPGTITVITSDGNAIVRDGESTPVDAFDDLSDRVVFIGEAVATSASGTASLYFNEYRTSASIQAASKLLLEKTPDSANDTALTLRIERGSVLLSCEATETGRVAIIAGSGTGQGHIVISDGIALAVFDGANVEFTAVAGSVTYFQGSLPGTPGAGVALDPGQRISPGGTPETADPNRADEVIRSTTEGTYVFGVQRCENWLKAAEVGDFTPVRKEGSPASPTLVGTEFAPTQAFDQPTQLAVVAAPQTTTLQSLRTVVSPGAGLVQSGVPGSVIAGQRFRRSIIIGNPGTAGNGPITINPSAELLIRIAGQ